MDVFQPGFGRIYAEDPRDDKYLARPLLAVEPPTRKTVYYAMFSKPLNQGLTGTCVGHAGKHFMLTAPTIQTKPAVEPTAITLYKEACTRDEWTFNDSGDLQFGTSIRGMMKALQDRGLIGSYVWGRTVDDVIDWICSGKGPVILGTDWYRSMMQTTDEGIMQVDFSSGRAGGHGYLVSGWDNKKGLLTGPNSWGDTFGRKLKSGKRDGRFRLDPTKADRLISEGGEAGMAVELRLNRNIGG